MYPGSHKISIWMGHGSAVNLTVVVPPFTKPGEEEEDTHAALVAATEER